MASHTKSWNHKSHCCEKLKPQPTPCYRPDIWFVTITQALVWMTDPRPAKNLNTFDAWNCAKRQNIPPPPCNLPSSCALPFRPPEANVSSIR